MWPQERDIPEAFFRCPGRIGDVYRLWRGDPDLSMITGPIEVFRSPIGWCARYPSLCFDGNGGGPPFEHHIPLWALRAGRPAHHAELVAAADAWACWPQGDVELLPRLIPCPPAGS